MVVIRGDILRRSRLVTGLRYLMVGGAWDRRSNVHICLITLNKMVLLLHYKCFASFILFLTIKYAQIKEGSPCI